MNRRSPYNLFNMLSLGSDVWLTDGGESGGRRMAVQGFDDGTARKEKKSFVSPNLIAFASRTFV